MSLSLATDLGFDQPAEHMVRSARLGMRLGERLGLDDADLAVLYDVNILTYVGCPGVRRRVGGAVRRRHRLPCRRCAGRPRRLPGDDVHAAPRRGRHLTGEPGRAGHPADGQRWPGCRRADGQSLLGCGCVRRPPRTRRRGARRHRAGLRAMGRQGRARRPRRATRSRSPRASRTWPRRARWCTASSGLDQAVDMVQARSGTHFDPAIAAAVCADPESLFDGIDDRRCRRVPRPEPVPRPAMTDEELDRCARGDRRLLRPPVLRPSPVTAAAPPTSSPRPLRCSHSAPTRRASCTAPRWCTTSGASACRDRCGQAGPAQLVRSGAHAPARVLRGADLPAPRTAAAHRPARRHPPRAHGRVGLSPRHRGPDALDAGAPARRRRRLPRDDATASVPRRAARRRTRHASCGPRSTPAGSTATRSTPCSPRPVTCVGRPRAAAGPAGLTAREADVLGLLAQGCSNKAIASALGISAKTVGNHVEHIYTKLGVTNRAGAALRAMELGVVGAAPVIA